MADNIDSVLEYLRWHHFSRVEVVLREEVSLRQQSNGPRLGDDLDRDVATSLELMQEKGAQQVEVVPDKRVHDKLVTEVKSLASWKRNLVA